MEGNRIRELREAKGMTQLRLSLELDVTQETVSAYETGKHLASVKTLIKMSEIFNASMDYIMGLSDIRKPMKASNLNNDEVAVIGAFRKLNHIQKEKALSYMEGMLSCIRTPEQIP